MTGEWLKTSAMLAILLALALATLPGCSMLRLGYGQFDTFAAWTADDYFDLDPQQKHEFVTRFDRLHEWHRYEQLPEYALFLASAKARLQKGFTREDVIWFVEGLKTRYRTIVNRGADDAAIILLAITPAQFDALQKRWDKDNRRFIREYRLEGSVEEQRRERARRALSQIRDWFGSLSYEQEQSVVAMVNELPLIDRLRYEDRRRRQREFLQLMELRGDPREFAARLKHWLLNWEEGRAPEYDRVLTEWWDQRVDLFVAVERTLTPHQRAAAARRLQNYIEDFTRLAERPVSAAASR